MLRWLIFGLIVGAIAKMMMPGKGPQGCLMTSLLGIGGSLLFGLIAGLLFGARGPAGYIGSVIGAMLIMWLYNRRERSS